MPHPKLRSQRQVVERCVALGQEVREAQPAAAGGAAAAIASVWRGEALGTLLWSLSLVELPPYDRAFATGDVLAIRASDGRLRDAAEIGRALAVARLWHWRARTTELQQAGSTALPAGYSSFEQLIGATAMRGHEQGLIAQPFRGDFRAFGKVYRHLSASHHAEAYSIAHERHHALAWLTGSGPGWDDIVLET